VTAKQAWAAEVNADAAGWCTLLPASGTTSGTINVNVAENPTITARAATITFTAGTMTAAVAVTQGANSAALSTDKATIEAAYTAGTYTLNVTATQAWSAEVNAAATWCSIAPDFYAGSRAVTVSVTENQSIDPRAATVTFTSGTLSKNVTVSQAGNTVTPPHAASTQTWRFGNYLWSDVIQMPGCNKSSWWVTDNRPDCRSYTYNNITYYYYNWLELSYGVFCKAPWALPTEAAYEELQRTTTAIQLADVWGVGGSIANGIVVAAETTGYIWSSHTVGPWATPYYIWWTKEALGVHLNQADRSQTGVQVRCVRDL
jgi:hypothetical protein